MWCRPERAFVRRGAARRRALQFIVGTAEAVVRRKLEEWPDARQARESRRRRRLAFRSTAEDASFPTRTSRNISIHGEMICGSAQKVSRPLGENAERSVGFTERISKKLGVNKIRAFACNKIFRPSSASSRETALEVPAGRFASIIWIGFVLAFDQPLDNGCSIRVLRIGSV